MKKITPPNAVAVKKLLCEMGFETTVQEKPEFFSYPFPSVTMAQYGSHNDDYLKYFIELKTNAKGIMEFDRYQLYLSRVPVPDVTIKGVNTRGLEQLLITGNRFFSDYISGIFRGETENPIKVAYDKVEEFYGFDDEAKELAKLIMYKHGGELRTKTDKINTDVFNENYKTTLIVDRYNPMHCMDAYQLAAKKFCVPEIKGMEKEHVISDELIGIAQFELSKGNNWIACNDIPYFIDKNDVFFFKTKYEAQEFSVNNISDYDNFKVMHVSSIQDFLNQIPYGEKINHLLSIDPDANGLYNKDGNAFTDALIEHIESQQLSSIDKQLKTNIMNNENLQYLKDNIKYMGFGESLHGELERNLGEGKADFQLQLKTEMNKKPFEATLNFRKSDSSDMYFFNNYHASLEKSNGEKNEQTFYLNKGKGVTAKEAYNLLDGRAVHKELTTKEGQPYKAWIQLDFENKDKNNNNEVKQFHENYGYDLKAAVGKFAVAELNDPEKSKALFQSLEKGNVQSITIEKDGSSQKMFMEADPQYKKVTLYDSSMKMVAKESLNQYKAGIDKGSKEVKQGQENDKKKDLKQEAKPEKEKQAQKNEKSLLPKKRESKGKGLGVS